MTNLTAERLNIIAPEEASSLLGKLKDILDERGIECYVVGGFVRDALLGLQNRDIDVAVAGDAAPVASAVAHDLGTRVVPLGDLNQTFRVVVKRADSHWHLDFATMRGSIEEDLRERDFTINAIAVSLADMTGGMSEVSVVDPLEGESDLRTGTIRAVSEDAFRKDPARLLRAIRFAAVRGFSVEADTEALMQRDAALVGSVAPERLLDELGRVLDTHRAYSAFRTLERLGLLQPLMPELASTRGVTQPKEHFWDVFEHSLETVGTVERVLRQSGEPDDEVLRQVPWSQELERHFEEEIAGGRSRAALLKLAGLLHDLGKPATKTVEESGRMRFLGHPREGAGMAADLMRRLRFSNREIEMVQLLTEHHMRPHFLARDEVPTRRAIYRFFRDTGDVGIDTLFLGLADHLAARGPTLDPEEWRRDTETTRYVLSKWFEEQDTVSPPKLIDGHTIMDRLGVAPGPQVGQILEAVREAQAAGEIVTAEEALDLARKTLEVIR
jgi:putative nucleotidyltransferase with HDIG domain